MFRGGATTAAAAPLRSQADDRRGARVHVRAGGRAGRLAGVLACSFLQLRVSVRIGAPWRHYDKTD